MRAYGERRAESGDGRGLLLCATAAVIAFSAGPLPRSVAPAQVPPAMPAYRLAESAARAEEALQPEAHGSGGIGRVTCLDGPVPGLRIASVPSGAPRAGRHPRAVFTDASGCFPLGESAGGEGSPPRRLLALGAGGALLEAAELPPSSADATPHWRLPWRLVLVRLCDDRGTPLAGRAIACSPADPREVFLVRHSTDAEGRFAVLVRSSEAIELAIEGGSGCQRAEFRASPLEHIWRVERR